MIRYALKCPHAHEFEAWFSSSSGFEDQQTRGLIECPMCGATDVEKAIMAPSVRTTKGKDPVAEAHRVMAEAAYQMRQHVEKNFDYVGDGFAKEARDIHEGYSKDRPIYGEATLQDVKSLIEDGVPVAPLPMMKPLAPQADVPVLPSPSPKPAGNSKLN
jgi:hypothetical protein